VQYLTIWDVVLTPIYLMVLTFIAKWWRDKKYPKGHPLRRYYLPGLYVKFASVIFIALVYQYYYGYGDTLGYFQHSQIINSALGDSFNTWFKLVTRQSWISNPELYPYVSEMFYYNFPDSHIVASISAVLGLLNGTTYIPIALLFAFLAYTGIWAMYKTFVSIFPQLHKQLAFAFLFIPSTFVWGSGIFKDTICLFALGWLTYSTFRIFINKDLSIKNLLFLFVSFYLLAIVKIYILLAFVPALCLWLLMTYSGKIRNSAIRWFANILCVALVLLAFNFFASRFSTELNEYSLEKIAQTAEITSEYVIYMSGDEGSAYNIGKFEPTLSGLVKKFPMAVTVTLFRPFPWEARKLIVLLPALEALLFLLLTLVVIFKLNRSAIKGILKDPTIIFCLIYSLIFAFAVGMSTGNFGTLSRYKIPCLPFYALALILIYFHHSAAGRKTAAG